jgi:hypothetical protein
MFLTGVRGGSSAQECGEEFAQQVLQHPILFITEIDNIMTFYLKGQPPITKSAETVQVRNNKVPVMEPIFTARILEKRLGH